MRFAGKPLDWDSARNVILEVLRRPGVDGGKDRSCW
jgi:hypothetical protein